VRSVADVEALRRRASAPDNGEVRFGYAGRTLRCYLNIDNNASERALKRVALGRKNWLFAGNDAAAENHARLWSLIASCERHKVDPQRYLTSVLAKIGTTPREELEQFLPDAWKAEDVAD